MYISQGVTLKIDIDFRHIKMLEIGTYVHDLKSYFHSIQFYDSQIIYTVIHLYVDSTNKNLNLIHPHKMVENLKD